MAVLPEHIELGVRAFLRTMRANELRRRPDVAPRTPTFEELNLSDRAVLVQAIGGAVTVTMKAASAARGVQPTPT